MEDVPIAREQVQDPAEKNEPGLGLGRDPERTPMPRDGTPRAGFSSGVPWLPLGADHASVNVVGEDRSHGSMLNLHRRLIRLRRERSALTQGSIKSVAVQGNVLTHERCQANERIVILLNLSNQSVRVSQPVGRLLVSTYLDCAGKNEGKSLLLRANEGIVVQPAE
jgi:alpha-glucosidase